MEIVGAGLGIVGVVLAIVIPLAIERLKRPKLVLMVGTPVTDMRGGQGYRGVRVAVVNEPITGWLGRQLLRETASGCRVSLTFRSADRSNELGPFPGRWVGGAVPLRTEVVAPNTGEVFYDEAVALLSEVEDIPPGRNGREVEIAQKREVHSDSYVHTNRLYEGGSSSPYPFDLALEADEYAVTVTAEAGGVVESRTFRLTSVGDQHTGLRLDARPIRG